MSQERIHLYYSNETERLIPALVANLRKQRAAADPFQAIDILVPNKNMETFLKFNVAAEWGIAANLRFLFLRRYLASLVTDAYPHIRIMDREEIRALLLNLLTPERLSELNIDYVPAYLLAGGDSPDQVDIRRFQLATKLADLFLEYSFSRRDMLAAWDQGHTMLDGTAHSERERWQRTLWRELIALRDRLPTGERWLTLMEAWDQLGAPDSHGGELRLDALNVRPLHVFGISYIARAFQQVLHILGRRTDVHIYTLNPCAEFWEDVESEGERIRRERFRSRSERLGERLDASEDPFQLEVDGDTPALRLWGRPGRENIRLLNELTDCDFQAGFANPLERGRGLLPRIQHDILYREPEGSAPVPDAGPVPVGDDRSIRFLACPGIRREVEIVANEIWRLIRENQAAQGEGVPKLRFSDIGVIVNSNAREEYYTHVGAVFRGLHDIPHSIVDRELAAGSQVGEALELLLRLPLGNFTRKEMLRLLTHPVLCGRFPEVSPRQWQEWCERVNIIFGADREALAGTYLEGEDLLNWDQGLRRLTLGAFMAGERSGEEGIYASPHGQVVPEEVGADSLHSVGRFALMARSLLADARFCRQERMTLREWSAYLARLVECYLSGTDEEERAVLLRCTQTLQSMEDLEPELTGDGGEQGGFPVEPVGYRIASELALELVGGIPAGGRYLSDGVTVSSFLPMRAIPFKVVFVLGLGEGLFPTGEPADPLDLRQARRMAGDVDRREQERYMFLETLLCTRERLYLSYVARDARTGESLEPSTVIRELQYILQRGYLEKAAGEGDDAIAPLVEKHPLARYDLRYFPDLSGGGEQGAGNGAGGLVSFSPIARREAQSVLLHDSLTDHLRRQGVAPGDLDHEELLENLTPEARSVVRQRLAFPEVPVAEVDVDVRTLSISATALRRFLECPLQGAARLILGLFDDREEDVFAREDEVFTAGGFADTGFLRQVFMVAEGDPAQLQEEYTDRYRLLALKGIMPAGCLADVQGKRHWQSFRAWHEQLDALDRGDLAGYRVHQFGQAAEFATADVFHGPIRLLHPHHGQEGGGEGSRIELSGSSEWLAGDGDSSLTLLSSNRITDKDRFRAFWNMVLLAAAEVPLTETFEAVLVADGAGKPVVCAFHSPSPEEARQYLQGIVDDAYEGAHDYLLPLEAVFAWRKQVAKEGDHVPLTDCIAATLENGSHSSRWGPVHNIDRFRIPEEEEAREWVARRFGLYFALQTQGKAAK